MCEVIALDGISCLIERRGKPKFLQTRTVVSKKPNCVFVGQACVPFRERVPEPAASMKTDIKIPIDKAVLDYEVERLFRTLLDVDVVGHHFSVVSAVRIKDGTIVVEDRIEKLFICMSDSAVKVLEELLLNSIAELAHVVGIPREEATAHGAQPHSDRLIQTRPWLVINVTRGELVSVLPKYSVEVHAVLESHSLNADVEPREVS
jgi:hypothetical protein